MADHGRRRRRIAHLLAPAALVLAVGAVGYVITSSTGSDADNGGESTERGEQRPTRSEQEQPRRQRAFYRVKLNDTLGLIAEKTDVAVEQLEALNPELDPQNLVVGQRIRLRE